MCPSRKRGQRTRVRCLRTRAHPLAPKSSRLTVFPRRHHHCRLTAFLWHEKQHTESTWSGTKPHSNIAMLTPAGQPLPPQIYRLIYSYIDRLDLTQLLRVCHPLFKITAPCLWTKVDWLALLRLLPGYRINVSKYREIEVHFKPHD